MKQVICGKNSTWWNKRSTLERGLTVALTCSVLIAAGLAIAYGIVASNNICLTPECIHIASSILDYMDESVEPCDNFYRFACGGFLKKTVIPDDKTMVSTMVLLNDRVMEQLRSSIEEEYNSSDPRHFKLVKTLYKMCMNKTAIEKRGLAPLLKHLKDLGGWPVLEGDRWNESDFNWKDSVYKFRKMGESFNYFLSFAIDIDLKNTTNHIIALSSAILDMYRDYLVKGLDDEYVTAYYNYMVDIAVLLGADRDRAARELKESLQFQIQLANISLPSEELRNISVQNNPITVRELTRRYPSIPWLEYCNTLLAPMTNVTEDEIVNVLEPRFISNFERLIKQVPKRVQSNYVMWRVVAESIPNLTEELRKRLWTYSASITGQFNESPRWKECISVASAYFSHSVSALYIRKYFNKDSKQKVSEMVSDIREQFIKILHTIDWMDDKTRKAALDKVEAMGIFVAYPDELMDDSKIDKVYKNIEITADNYFETMINLDINYINHVIGQLRRPINKTDWKRYSGTTVVNAYYDPSDNSISLPAGILQGAFFSNNRPRYINYGAIGFVIGHEITHGFDDSGSQYDKDGNLVDWWMTETKKKYLEKAECIISQYGNYTESDVNLNLNGVNTQGENIADNGGLKEAYLAYNEWVRRNGAEPRLPGLKYNGQQMFWISKARAECRKYRPEVLKMLITTDVHSPAEFRILGSMSNIPQFARDFNCPIGSPMNPEKKCVVW